MDFTATIMTQLIGHRFHVLDLYILVCIELLLQYKYLLSSLMKFERMSPRLLSFAKSLIAPGE